MNIKTAGFAVIMVCVTAGCAGTGGTREQQAVQGGDAEPGTKIVQSSNSNSYDPNEVTCKSIERTGTRFKEKLCLKNRAWEAAAESAQATTEGMQRRPQYKDSGG